MRTYQWWRKQKRRVQKKYTLLFGRYLSPKEIREWHNKWISSMQELKDYAEWLPQYEGKWVAESEYKRCKDECKKEAEDKGLVMSDEECKPCEYLYVCPYMMAEMNDIVEGN